VVGADDQSEQDVSAKHTLIAFK